MIILSKASIGVHSIQNRCGCITFVTRVSSLTRKTDATSAGRI